MRLSRKYNRGKMDIKSIFKQNKIRPTKARVFILNLIANSSKPADATTLLQSIRDNRISIDRATVFRAIQLFLERKIIRKVEFSEGKFRYELNSLSHHHHLVCNNCKEIESVELRDIEPLEKKIQKNVSFLIQSHNLEFFGLCKNCQ